MNKFILYGILLLVYLGLSKSLSPTEFGVKYINNDEALAEIINGAPVSVILTDIHSTGFLIKTFYHKYKIIYGFQAYDEIIIRTSRSYTEKKKPFLGMSIFRRYKEDSRESFTPLPPGSVFIGNRSFGSWVTQNSQKVWRFFRVYRQIPKYLEWNDFVPNIQIYNEIIANQEKNIPYYGENKEFGIKGSITQAAFPKYFERQKPEKVDLKSFLQTYIKENFIN